MQAIGIYLLLFLCLSEVYVKGNRDQECLKLWQECDKLGRDTVCNDEEQRCSSCRPGCETYISHTREVEWERCKCKFDDSFIDDAAQQRSQATRNELSQEFIQPSSDAYQNEGQVKVHNVNHVEHHSNEEKLKTVQSQAKDVADKIATTRILESPALPAAHRQDKKSSAIMESTSMADVYFLVVVAGCSVAGLVGLVVAGVCWYKLQKNVKAASEAEYPAYGVTGPTKERLGSPGDRKLAQSAQMYHYQHQKQQMIALEKANGEMKHDGSDEDSEEENEEGDYTVYECPGLAPTGEMEVKNPLFSEETPVTPTPGDEKSPDHK